MKKFMLFGLLALTSIFISTSCSKEQTSIDQPKEKVVDMKKYNAKVVENIELIKEVKNSITTKGVTENNNAFQKLQDELIFDACDFVDELGLTPREVEELFGGKLTIEEYEEAIVGLLVFASAMNLSIVPSTRGGDFVDCFLEATGIAAGAAIVGGLAAGTMSKAMLKQAVKLVAKVGGRTLSGIGLALVVGEMAYCMW